MKRTRFSVEQTVAVLKQAEMDTPVANLIRHHGIAEQSSGTSCSAGNSSIRSGRRRSSLNAGGEPTIRSCPTAL